MNTITMKSKVYFSFIMNFIFHTLYRAQRAQVKLVKFLNPKFASYLYPPKGKIIYILNLNNNRGGGTSTGAGPGSLSSMVPGPPASGKFNKSSSLSSSASSTFSSSKFITHSIGSGSRTTLSSKNGNTISYKKHKWKIFCYYWSI